MTGFGLAQVKKAGYSFDTSDGTEWYGHIMGMYRTFNERYWKWYYKPFKRWLWKAHKSAWDAALKLEAARNKEKETTIEDYLEEIIEPGQEINGSTSDGYHTFDDLYDHRCHLYIALMKSHYSLSWISKKHVDGSMFPDWFIAGMNLPTGDITYHLPLWMWDMFDGSNVKVLDFAPEWDGHTPHDVVERLAEWIRKK